MIFFILRNTIPAGLIIIRMEETIGEIILDYALKNFRDFKIGAFVFEDNADILRRRGIDKLVTKGETPTHKQYLRQMGFTQDKNDMYIKRLNPHFILDKKI